MSVSVSRVMCSLSQFLVVPLSLTLLASGMTALTTPVAGNKADQGLELSRQKRSLGMLATMFNRIMFSEVQDAMELDYTGEVSEETIQLVKCELVLERKTCQIGETETVCKNYFGRQCFLYTYPSTSITVENTDGSSYQP